MNTQVPIHFHPRYDKGLWLVFLAVPLLPLGRAGSLVAAHEYWLAFVMFGVAGLATLALWFLLPRKFELWPDYICIVLGRPWRFVIPLEEVMEVLPSEGLRPWAGLGAAFATSFKTPVHIKRSKGMNILLSPENPEEFITAVKDSLANSPAPHGPPLFLA